MQIKLKTNSNSTELNKIPFYTDWDHVLLCELGDVQDTFFDESEINCMLIMGKDGKSMEDYFALVELGDFVDSEEFGLEFVSSGQSVWVHHHFLYDELGNKLQI